MTKIENKFVASVLENNFNVIKKHLTILIQSIFDNLNTMPIGLRIVCKIIDLAAKRKFPELTEVEYNKILSNYLIRKWISPSFTFPEHNGILDDPQTNEETFANFMEITKV